MDNDATERQGFEGWCVLELMGHRRLAGFVREATIGGGSFIRIDVPGADGEPGATQFYAPGSVYAITPTTEDVARRFAARARPEPVQEWELPRRLPAGSTVVNVTDADGSEKCSHGIAVDDFCGSCEDSGDELLEAAKLAQCSCSISDRESGHRVDCWMPRLRDAIAQAEG